MSRSRIFVLFAALAVLATVFAACGGGSDDSSEDPQKVLETATLQGVKSGTLDLSLQVRSQGEEAGDIDVSLSGPFQSKGQDALPELGLELSAKGQAGDENIDFDGGLTLLSDRAFVQYKGEAYEVDPTTFGFVRSALERAQSEGGEEGSDITACQKAAESFDVGSFVANPVSEGGVDVDGTSTTKVSGELNVGGAIDGLIELTENPACRKQLEAAGPLPVGELEDAKNELRKAVKDAKVEVYLGEDDIVRKLSAEATIEPEQNGDKVELSFEITLGAVNEEQSISGPENAKPLEQLFRQLGVNPLELFQAGSSGGLGGLLEGVTGGSGGEGSGGGGGQGSGGSGSGSGEAGGGGGDQQAYLKCLEGAKTPADLQKCASKLN